MPALFTIHLQEQKSAELSAEPDPTTDSAQEDPGFFFWHGSFQLFQFPVCTATQQVMPAQHGMAVNKKSDDRIIPKIKPRQNPVGF